MKIIFNIAVFIKEFQGPKSYDYKCVKAESTKKWRFYTFFRELYSLYALWVKFLYGMAGGKYNLNKYQQSKGIQQEMQINCNDPYQSFLTQEKFTNI